MRSFILTSIIAFTMMVTTTAMAGGNPPALIAKYCTTTKDWSGTRFFSGNLNTGVKAVLGIKKYKDGTMRVVYASERGGKGGCQSGGKIPAGKAFKVRLSGNARITFNTGTGRFTWSHAKGTAAGSLQ